MPFRLRHADQIVGGFLIAVLLVVVAAVVLLVRSQDLFKRRIAYTTVFDDGSGLKPETPVKIAGIEVGKVRRVRLTRDNHVEVTFDVLEDYVDRLVDDPPGFDCERDETTKKRCGSRMAASVPAGLGAFLPTGGGLTINVGHAGNPQIEPGGVVKSEKPEGLSEILARLQHEGVVQNAKDIVEQVAVLMRRINDVKGPIWHTVENVEAVTTRAKDGKGLVGEVLSPGSKLNDQVRTSLDSLERSLGNLEKSSSDVSVVTEGIRGRQAEILKLLTNLEKFSDDARVVGARLNTLSAEAEKLPPDVRAAVANLDHRIDELGDILRGLKKTFPLSLVVEERSEADKQVEKQRDAARPAAP